MHTRYITNLIYINSNENSNFINRTQPQRENLVMSKQIIFSIANKRI